MNDLFACGFGIRDLSGAVCYKKVFELDEKNYDKVADLFRLLHKHFGYEGGNKSLSLVGVDLECFKSDLANGGHNGTLDYLSNMKGHEVQAVICIMEADHEPQNTDEAYLILDMFAEGKFNALNKKQRHALIKVFPHLPTIPLTMGGIPGSVFAEGFDKIPSLLWLKTPGTNRFAPTSFVRYGVCIGSENTFMFGATVNMGVLIGDGNLFDGHCSIASCAQIGNNNKVGSFVSIEGVLSPVNELPVIVGSNNFFGTRCRIGTGLVIGNKNFWGSGVDLSKGTPLRDFREGSPTYGKYVKAGLLEGIQGKDSQMITLNRARRMFKGAEIYPGEYILMDNTEENQARFARNNDLTAYNWLSAEEKTKTQTQTIKLKKGGTWPFQFTLKTAFPLFKRQLKFIKIISKKVNFKLFFYLQITISCIRLLSLYTICSIKLFFNNLCLCRFIK